MRPCGWTERCGAVEKQVLLDRAVTEHRAFRSNRTELDKEEEGQKGRRSGPSGVVHLREVGVVQLRDQ